RVSDFNSELRQALALNRSLSYLRVFLRQYGVLRQGGGAAEFLSHRWKISPQALRFETSGAVNTVLVSRGLYRRYFGGLRQPQGPSRLLSQLVKIRRMCRRLRQPLGPN
ncbi:hypothetical protein, partial [Pyrobaculum aerophilum]|uniref:hypothetical protein n=1 Tax=Pyrobaculum aerophilum TaxID=13773 RepID=UPI001C6F146F